MIYIYKIGINIVNFQIFLKSKVYVNKIGINIVNYQNFLIIYTKNFNFSLYLCTTTTSLSTLCQTKTCSFMTWD